MRRVVLQNSVGVFQNYRREAEKDVHSYAESLLTAKEVEALFTELNDEDFVELVVVPTSAEFSISVPKVEIKLVYKIQL